jgi:hypothetical protein
MLLLSATDPSSADDAYWQLENYVVAQGSLFEVAEPATQILVASLVDERATHIRISVLDLLYQILSGEPDASEIAHGNVDLVDRCRELAREGAWLLIKEFVNGQRDAARDVLQLIKCSCDYESLV